MEEVFCHFLLELKIRLNNLIMSVNIFLLKFWAKINLYSYHQLRLLASKDSEENPKHSIIRYDKFFLEKINNADEVLDVGCSKGWLSNILSKKAKYVLGIDFNEKSIESAKKYASDNLKFVVGDVVAYNFNQKFDVVILSNVLEHIENRVDFLKRISQIGKKLLVRVPLVTRDWVSVYKKNKGLPYKLDDSHYIEYREEEIYNELQEAGFKIVDSKIMFGEIYIEAYRPTN
jgi:SAM-dependent methyltransferase